MKRKIEVSEETYQKIKEHLADEPVKELSSYEDMIGEKYYFRTITYHLTGRVIRKVGDFLELEDAAWIASSGRFMQAIKNGVLDEVEPVGSAFVNISATTDFFPWNHELPMEQK